MKKSCLEVWKESDIQLMVRKEAGAEQFDIRMEASCDQAIIQGLSAFVVTFAEKTGYSVATVLGLIANEILQEVEESEEAQVYH